MSMYLIFDGGEPEDFCSNRGYGDFCRWVDSLGKKYPVLRKFRKAGGCDDAGSLKNELTAAENRDPPTDAPTASMVRNLIESLNGNSVTISNGIIG